MVYFTESSVETGKFVYCHNVKWFQNFINAPLADRKKIVFPP